MQPIRNLFGFRTCGYSPTHRAVEVLAIATFASCSVLLVWKLVAGFQAVSLAQGSWLLSLSLILGYLTADFSSGFVHWMGDTFGDENTPVLGKSFVKPFRDHHVDPRDITRHDFIEVNGNNSIVLLSVLIPAVLFLPT
ncbi:MAG: fatty acid desaturase CarF family protein, partial [Bradymonadaceae bacterium]